MSISEAAEALRVTPPTIYRMIRDKRLEAVEYPHLRHGRYRIVRESVEQYLPPERRATGEPGRARPE